MDKIREEFESWFLIVSGVDVFSDRDGDAYKCEDDESTRYLCGIWLSWKASRSALCVELNNVVFSRDKNGEGGLMLPERVFKAMDDAGVSYK